MFGFGTKKESRLKAKSIANCRERINAVERALGSGDRRLLRVALHELTLWHTPDELREDVRTTTLRSADWLLGNNDLTIEDIEALLRVKEYEERVAKRALLLDHVSGIILQWVIAGSCLPRNLRLQAIARLTKQPNELDPNWLSSFFKKGTISYKRPDTEDERAINIALIALLNEVAFDSKRLLYLCSSLNGIEELAEVRARLKEALHERELVMCLRYSEEMRGYIPLFRDKDGVEFVYNWRLLERWLNPILERIPIMGGENLIEEFCEHRMSFYAK